MPTKTMAAALLAFISICCHIFYHYLLCLCKSSATVFIIFSTPVNFCKNSVLQMTSYIRELHKNLSTDEVLIFDSQNSHYTALLSCPRCPAQHLAQSRCTANVNWMTKWRDQFLSVMWYHLYPLKRDRFVRKLENTTTDCSHLATLVYRERSDLPVSTCQPYWGSWALQAVSMAKRREIFFFFFHASLFLNPCNFMKKCKFKKDFKKEET